MDSSTNETSKLSVSIATALLIAGSVMLIVTMNFLPLWILVFLIPGLAYGISILMSVIYQYATCGSVQAKSIAITNLSVLATNSVVSIILFLETLPLLLSIFGPYPTVDPVTGIPYNEDSPQYEVLSRDKYKVQFFSKIVKAVLPPYINESLKDGAVYFYWVFWMSIIPMYFAVSVQGLCP